MERHTPATGGLPRRPVIGAEIMDDPMATPDKVDGWFRTLAEYGLPLARVFIPRTEEGLARMDGFFRAAERYGVGITATLGGSPAEDTGHWIRQAVRRYQDSPALDSWILINEPGWAPRGDALAVSWFRTWLKDKHGTVEALNRAWNASYASFDAVDYDPQWIVKGLWSRPGPFLDWYTFWRGHLTWHLNWIAEQIRHEDRRHPTHVNPHALVSNLAANSVDLPSWRPFLDSLGASIHPSWHFTVLGRDQYALGVSYVSDLIRGAIEPKPFWITELQGGNNTNSGNRPLYPTPADIAQWLWVGFGAGADRVVFWLLNNRSFGGESGEWSLLDFQDQPSERLEAAGRVARVLKAHDDFFRDAAPVIAPITIVLSLETMALQERFERTQPVTTTERGVATRLEGRGRNAHLYAALACYEALTELGIPVRVKHLHDFPWRAEGDAPQLAILPNLAALSAEQALDITSWVERGNTALITGLTGAWDPENRFWPLSGGWPLEGLLGATLRELRTVDGDGFRVELQDPALALPTHLWLGEIRNQGAEVIGRQEGLITAVRRQAGAGRAIWIPSLVDVAAWLGDHRPLARLLAHVAAPLAHALPFRLGEAAPGCVLRMLQNGAEYVTVLTNGTNKPRHLRLEHPEDYTPTVLWREGSNLTGGSEATLEPRGTLVVLWR